MDPVLSVAVLSVVLGAVIVFVFFKNYLRKQRSEVQTIAKPELHSDPKKPSKPPQSKKSHPKPHSHSSDKDQNKRHHPLDLNTLKGHADSVTGLCFSPDGRNLATACADGVVRVFKLEDASSKSFKFLRINVPAGGHPLAVAFSDDASSVVVASQTLSGCSLYMYGEEKPKTSNDSKQQTKLPLPEIKWEHHKIHDKRAVLTLTRSTASYGTADGSTIIASCSEGTDIILWHGKTGKVLGHVDTNQLKNNMATVSPNGRFLAAAAFTADVKVFPIPLHDSNGSALHYDRLSLSPDGKILATTHGSTLQWLCMDTGKVLDTAEKAHDGDITGIAWSPKTIPLGNEQVMVLATASIDKKVKLWAAPSVNSS
ncbi:hypothetical protein COLO4_12543 [Corchorus olitorius]|uniref:Uncharacterized protein n=1 Tax=Corchorus olitorius TaxID=93759 RepID=A0A1R3K0J4_9ROSI|nr:hypothetical protein COLO4_12543 [Corchorus olitorius]